MKHVNILFGREIVGHASFNNLCVSALRISASTHMCCAVWAGKRDVSLSVVPT